MTHLIFILSQIMLSNISVTHLDKPTKEIILLITQLFVRYESQFHDTRSTVSSWI